MVIQTRRNLKEKIQTNHLNHQLNPKEKKSNDSKESESEKEEEEIKDKEKSKKKIKLCNKFLLLYLLLIFHQIRILKHVDICILNRHYNNNYRVT